MADEPIGLQGRVHPYEVEATSDHWFPTGVQRLWVDGERSISRVGPDGRFTSKVVPKKKPNRGFGDIRSGHAMVFGVSPWNHSFEADFNDVDREAPVVLRKLRDDLFEAGLSAESLNLNIQEAATLVAYCFSVLLRSPAYRHRMSFAGVGFGLPQDERVGRANVQQAWRSAKTIDLQECNRADLRLLVSRDAEFIFADGLVDGLFSLDASISWRAVGQRWIADLRGEALVPLLPNLCAYLRFSRSGLGCRVKTIDVEPDVTSSVNALTQIYAKDDLFFRSETPTLTRDFICGEHRALESFEIELMRWLRST